jgi:hypothetical protein
VALTAASWLVASLHEFVTGLEGISESFQNA